MPDQRETYFEAVDFFLAVAQRIPADQWEANGLGAWSIRDLVGHTSRTALANIERDLVSPVQPADSVAGRALVTAAEYFATAMAIPGINEGVAQRGHEAGDALGDDPIAAIRALEPQARALLEGTPDDAEVTTPFGTLSLPEYLLAKTFELTVHTLDVAAALGLDAEPPAHALAVTLNLALQIAARRAAPDAVVLLRALTGRASLPVGFSVL